MYRTDNLRAVHYGVPPGALDERKHQPLWKRWRYWKHVVVAGFPSCFGVVAEELMLNPEKNGWITCGVHCAKWASTNIQEVAAIWCNANGNELLFRIENHGLCRCFRHCPDLSSSSKRFIRSDSQYFNLQYRSNMGSLVSIIMPETRKSKLKNIFSFSDALHWQEFEAPGQEFTAKSISDWRVWLPRVARLISVFWPGYSACSPIGR